MITREIGRPDKAPFAFSFSSNVSRAGPFGSTTCRVYFLDPGNWTAKTHFLELSSKAPIIVLS
jgi:hypothetical protein